MNDVNTADEPAYISHLKAARRRPAVSKIELVQLRSRIGDVPIFAFEGDDDKIVFAQWIRRINNSLSYEPFPCRGKKGVRELKNLVARDRQALWGNLYYFVDRDFDDLAGFLDVDRVFITTTYSVENIIVCDITLDSLLRDTFPCHGLPHVRKRIVETFLRDYEDFLEVTRPINQRLFLAKRAPIKQLSRLPSSLASIAQVDISNVESLHPDPCAIVVLEREPTVQEDERLAAEFMTFDPGKRYRGKYALKFFEDWLRKLVAAFAGGEHELFEACDKNTKVRSGEHVLGNFAARSPIPDGLARFLEPLAS